MECTKRACCRFFPRNTWRSATAHRPSRTAGLYGGWVRRESGEGVADSAGSSLQALSGLARAGFACAMGVGLLSCFHERAAPFRRPTRRDWDCAARPDRLGMPRAGRRWRLMVLRGSILGPAPCLLGRGSYDSRPNREGVAARQVAPSVGGPLQLSWSGARQRSPGRLRRLETPPHKCHRWTISSGQQHRHMLQFGRIQRECGNSG